MHTSYYIIYYICGGWLVDVCIDSVCVRVCVCVCVCVFIHNWWVQVRGFWSDSKCAKAGESSSSNPLIPTLTLSPHPNTNLALESLNLSPLYSLTQLLTYLLTYSLVFIT